MSDFVGRWARYIHSCVLLLGTVVLCVYAYSIRACQASKKLAHGRLNSASRPSSHFTDQFSNILWSLSNKAV